MNTKSTKAANVWVGVIPDIFGYGITTIAYTKADAMKTLRQSYANWKKARPDSTTNFKMSYERFGGTIYQVEIGKAYHAHFNS